MIVSCELTLMLDSTIVNVALPEIREGLGFSPTGLSWVTTAFLLAFGGLLLLGGRAGDLLGKRKVFLAGMSLFTAASLVGGLAMTAEILVLARALQGVGAALAGPSTLALLVTNFRGVLQAKALGVYSSVTASAMTLGLVLGGVITTALSWRWALLINVPIGLVVLFLTPRYVEESAADSGSFDLVGAVASVAGLTALTFGLVRAADHGWEDGVPALAVGVVLLIAFVWLERRVRQPILPLRLFADRTRAAAFAIMLLVPMVTLSMQFLLVQFLQEVMGFSPLAAGAAFLPMAIGMLVAAQYASRLVGRFGAGPVGLGGLAALAAATGWLTRLSAETGYADGVFGPVLLTGVGLGLVIVPFNVVVMTGVDPAESGVASGVLQALNLTGASLGVAILSAVYALVKPGAGPQAVAEGMRAAFGAGLGVVAVATLVVVAFVRKKPRG
ncbi:MFS transporter [Sinosporangium siamense]|uniref:MFS transporter n=1 Tax=Sinosporangium siamense TaxID=1367973 RepID=A0A919VGV1_9ACTN|nr:MFS transporter [Sinosporangium siamense]GII97474.1 MFS transporter [Sinosporangium siamense]